MIYFIQAGGPKGPIKVGVAVAPQRRLQSHQAPNPQELSLLKVVPGDYRREARIKKDLKPWCQKGEWYHPTPEVLAYIRKCGCAEYEVHNGKAYAVVYRDKENTATEACPFCGQRHIHGISDGHRVARCSKGSEQVVSENGTVLEQKMGYIIRTRKA
jgi:hypothetical protein